MELYGLVSVLDEHHFGDEDSFRSQYLRAWRRNGHIFLRKRLEPDLQAHAAPQVQQAGLIRYTERSPLTMQYEPSQAELTLYTDVSAYLQRKDTIAFATGNQLVTMVVRKILGSFDLRHSRHAQEIIERLSQMLPPVIETVADTTS